MMALLQLVDQGQVSLALEHRHFDGPLSGPKSGQIARVPAIAGRNRADRLYKSLSVDINDE
jgi:hypothetical protein